MWKESLAFQVPRFLGLNYRKVAGFLETTFLVKIPHPRLLWVEVNPLSLYCTYVSYLDYGKSAECVNETVYVVMAILNVRRSALMNSG